MKIDTNTPIRRSPNFNGSWIDKIDQALGKLIKPKEFITKENQLSIKKCAEIAHRFYNPTAPETIKLSVKNGNKELEFLYNNSSWHKVRLSKKGEELNEFEIMHVKNDNDFAFYSTGTYNCRIYDEKFIKKYNAILTDWLPKLIKKYEKTKTPPSIQK